MANLEYSTGARNVLNKFHQVERVVYVEGQDDVPFWEIILNKFASFSFYLESVGGKPELNKRIADIENGDANYFVARDADYDDFDGPRGVIRTYGHSIENTMVTVGSIAKLIASLSKKQFVNVSQASIKVWHDDLGEKTKKLTAYAISNEFSGLGKNIIPDTCDKFLTSKNSAIT